MRCIRCQHKTQVIDSRTRGAKRPTATTMHALSVGTRVFGWWTDDFTVRRRRCLHCGERFWTIEIAVSDLKDAFNEVSENDALGMPWMKRPGARERRELEALEEVSVDDIAWRTQSSLAQ